MKVKINNVMMELTQALEFIKGLCDAYGYYALAARTDKREMKYMEEFGNSHQWFQDDPDDGTPYNEELNMWDAGELPGTCGIEIASYYDLDDSDLIDKATNAINEVATGYKMGKDKVYLIAGTGCDGGWDKHEIIVADAVCIGEVII